MSYRMPSVGDLKKNRYSILAVIVVLMALMVLYMLFINPIEEEKEGLKGNLSQQNALAQKFAEKLKQGSSIREDLQKRQQELSVMQKRLFRGNDPYQLAASMGEALSKGDQQHKLDVKTYQVLASKEFGLYQEVHLRFNLMTDIMGLRYFLQKVDEMETAMVVQEINIQKVQRKTGPDLVINVILAALMEKKDKT